MEILISDINVIGDAARQFVGKIGENRVFAFYGKMGAGKTTFIKAVCECLGVTDVVTSPTFAIVNDYSIEQSPLTIDRCSAKDDTKNRVQRIFHFDLYRIKRVEELYDMGYEDYFYDPTALCFIEWPEMAEELLPPETVCLTIEVQPDGSRIIREK